MNSSAIKKVDGSIRALIVRSRNAGDAGSAQSERRGRSVGRRYSQEGFMTPGRIVDGCTICSCIIKAVVSATLIV